MTEKSKQRQNGISEQDIAQFLRHNPEFFEQHAELLTELSLPHPSGSAVSLIERQVAVLRQRNTELRRRLGDLLDNARENDRLFDKTKRLVLAMLECDELGDLVDALYYSFDKEFGIQSTQLILFADELAPCNARVMHLTQAQAHLGRYFASARTVSGGLQREEIEFLFDREAHKVGSAAMAVLTFGEPLGALAIGNPDEHYYQSSMGTLFLSHIAEVLNRLLPRYLTPKKLS